MKKYIYLIKNSRLSADLLSIEKDSTHEDHEASTSVDENLKHIYEEDLICMIRILKHPERKVLHAKNITVVRPNVKSVGILENHTFRCSAHGLRANAHMQL